MLVAAHRATISIVSIRLPERRSVLPLAVWENRVDRDYLMRRHDEELAKAASATSEAGRVAHEGLANVFREAAERIGTAPTAGDYPTSSASGLTA